MREIWAAPDPIAGRGGAVRNTHGMDGTRLSMLFLASYEWKQRKGENPEGGECCEVMKWVDSMMREWPHRVLPVVVGDANTWIGRRS